MTRLLSIQYLRAIAVLMVVGYHACTYGWRTGFEIGAAGVDVFFIISGFILWTIAAERPPKPMAFLARRWGRVVPLYWIVTLAIAALALKWPDLIFDANPTPRHLALSLAFIHHMSPSNSPHPVLPVGWSLNDEMVFYLIFAASLMLPPERRFRPMALGLLCVAFVGALFPHLSYVGYNLMFIQFIAGAWLAQLRLDNQLPSRFWGWFMIGWAIIVFAILEPLDLYQTIIRPIAWGLPAMALVAGLLTLEENRPLPKIQPLLLLGDASYSIYLVHWPVMSALSFTMHKSHLIYLPISILVAVAAGIGLHYALERPLLRLFRERLGGAALPSHPT